MKLVDMLLLQMELRGLVEQVECRGAPPVERGGFDGVAGGMRAVAAQTAGPPTPDVGDWPSVRRLAHDLNNALTVVLGYGELAREGLGEGHPQGPDLEEIVGAARRAEGITRTLLRLGRANAPGT